MSIGILTYAGVQLAKNLPPWRSAVPVIQWHRRVWR